MEERREDKKTGVNEVDKSYPLSRSATRLLCLSSANQASQRGLLLHFPANRSRVGYRSRMK